ncbi:ankyrin repeat-containing domain protein, partial [Coprinopsis sp. MPI-PUGE-AT-0042]
MAVLSNCGLQQTTGLPNFSAPCAKALKSRDPLLAYAYGAWSKHANESREDAFIAGKLTQFIQGCRAFPVESDGSRCHLLGPLHVAAYFDLPISSAGPTHLKTPNLPGQIGGQTPLQLAARRNSLRALKELLRLSRILVNASDCSGRTALILASREGHEGAVSLLLNNSKVKVNQPDHDGDTALIVASSNGHVGTVRLLLSHPKIKANKADREGWTPLLWASSRGSESLVKLLLDHPQIKAHSASKGGRRFWPWYGGN